VASIFTTICTAKQSTVCTAYVTTDIAAYSSAHFPSQPTTFKTTNIAAHWTTYGGADTSAYDPTIEAANRTAVRIPFLATFEDAFVAAVRETFFTAIHASH
jgi:hypothetical protein